MIHCAKVMQKWKVLAELVSYLQPNLMVLKVLFPALYKRRAEFLLQFSWFVTFMQGQT